MVGFASLSNEEKYKKLLTKRKTIIERERASSLKSIASEEVKEKTVSMKDLMAKKIG